MANCLPNEMGEVMLYYLYMMADGDVSEREEMLFDNLCSEMKIDSEDKEEAITKCTRLVKRTGKAFDVILNEKIDENAQPFFFGLFKNKSGLSRIVWNLVNLGYADTQFSRPEKKIIKHLLEKWEIPDEIYKEMIDTAETMLTLTKHKEWIEKNIKPARKRNLRLKIIDQEIQELLSDMKLSIAELAM